MDEFDRFNFRLGTSIEMDFMGTTTSTLQCLKGLTIFARGLMELVRSMRVVWT